MARTGSQTLYRKPQYAGNEQHRLPIDSSVSASAPLYEGDLCKIVAGGGLAPLDAGAMSATIVAALARFLGLSGTAAPTTYWNSKMPESGVAYMSGEADLYGTSGDTFHFMDEVTVGADAQSVTLASNYAPAAPTAAAGGSGGTLPASTGSGYIAYVAWVTTLGEVPGAAQVTPTALTSGQNLTVTIAAIPSWAIGANVYIQNGTGPILFAGFVASGTTLVISAPVPGTRIFPLKNALAIGRVVPLEADVDSGKALTGLTGSTTAFVRVRFRGKFPPDNLF